MDQTFKITQVKPKNFTGDDGSPVKYYWYKALREDGVNFNFGSSVLHAVGENLKLTLEKRLNASDKPYYVEIVEKSNFQNA